MGGDEFGTLQAGKLADVLVVNGDVERGIALLQDRSRFLAVQLAHLPLPYVAV